MKKIVLLALILGLMANITMAQENKAQTPQKAPDAPYMTEGTMKSFKILKLDSVSIFDTKDIPNKRTALVFFDPECSHCINFIGKLLPEMGSFKKVNFYFISSTHDVAKLRKFNKEYEIEKYKNIKLVGKDKDFFFISHYGVKRFPGVVIYDQHKKFVKMAEGDEANVAFLEEYTK